MTESLELAWHPYGEPLPPGWWLAQEERVVSQHNHHRVLIARPVEAPVRPLGRVEAVA